MLPYKSLISIDKNVGTPVYLQVANALIREIKHGSILPGSRLPGSRTMAEILDIHRKTVVAAYDELYAQGWIELRPSSGTYVSSLIPEWTPSPVEESNKQNGPLEETGYPPLPRVLVLVVD
ncbi:MAG: winged helix-turn-helix domain-containing protein [Bacteroidota bacterium]